MNKPINNNGICLKNKDHNMSGFFADPSKYMSSINGFLEKINKKEGTEKNVLSLSGMAKGGDIHAQYYWGVCLALGYGCEKNNKMAFYWFNMATAGLRTPIGEESNDKKKSDDKKQDQASEKKPADEMDPAVKALNENTQAEAGVRVGDCFYYGKGVARSYIKAVYWYTKAAEKGNKEAQANLSHCFALGLGVAEDKKKANYWSDKAAGKSDEEGKL